MDEKDWEFEPRKPAWHCEACGYLDDKPMPKDRDKYYAKPTPRKCPKCKSLEMVPRGF